MNERGFILEHFSIDSLPPLDQVLSVDAQKTRLEHLGYFDFHFSNHYPCIALHSDSNLREKLLVQNHDQMQG